MRRVERALLVLALVLAAATATLWGLREADVLRWGSGDTSVTRLEALETRVRALPTHEPRVTEGDLVRALARIEALEAQGAGESASLGATLAGLAALTDQAAALAASVAALEERTLGVTESELNVALSQLEARVRDHIDALDGRVTALEQRPGGAVDHFLVAKVDWTVPDPMLARLCITYTAPGGVLERCERVGLVPAGDDLAEPAPVYAATVECWETARIGDPLPDCWR